MIALRALDHVALRCADLDEAAPRWAAQFGLTERGRGDGWVALSCDDEPVAVELRQAAGGEEPGFDHVAWELARTCSVEDAVAHLRGLGHACERTPEGLRVQDPEGNAVDLVATRERPDRRVAHARPADRQPVGHPRALGHVNFLTGALDEQLAFWTEGLGLRVTDWLGEQGVWLRLGEAHHVMALVDKGTAHLHHLAFDLVDVGHLRTALDHLGRHGRWLGWGPVRHGIGGNIAAYVRVVEEPCFVELSCDMERLAPDHEPRTWADDRFSSNTWGPLPPRSYFRFDDVAVEHERASLEALGVPLPDPQEVPA